MLKKHTADAPKTRHFQIVAMTPANRAKISAFTARQHGIPLLHGPQTGEDARRCVRKAGAPRAGQSRESALH